MKKDLEVKELFIDDFNNVRAISLVKSPAIEVDFLKFSNARMNISFAKVDTDKRILTGPAMIPDKQIYRYNPDTNEEFYVFFSPETVESISQEYLISEKNSNVTLQHETELENVTIVESWIVKDPEKDKASSLGYDVPAGTWMVSMKVTDDALWEEIKSSEDINGFSIEGFFVTNFHDMEEDKAYAELENYIMSKLEEYSVYFEGESPEDIAKQEEFDKKIADFLKKK